MSHDGGFLRAASERWELSGADFSVVWNFPGGLLRFAEPGGPAGDGIGYDHEIPVNAVFQLLKHYCLLVWVLDEEYRQVQAAGVGGLPTGLLYRNK